MAKDVKFNIKISIDGKEHIVTASTNVKRLAQEMEIAQTETTKFRDALLKINQVGQAFQNAFSGLQQIIGVMRTYTAASAVQEEAEAKLANNMRNTMGAREEDIQSIKDLCAAQQQLGVIGDEVQLAGAQELATYLEKKSSLEMLIPVMNDMVAQQYGLNATQESAANIATMLGKVMEGQVGALSRYGYKFDEAQEQILKFGTEEQRVAVLSEVVESAVGGMNEALAQTDAGKAKQAANDIGDLKEQVGALIAPYETLIVQIGEMGLALNAIIMTANGILGATRALTLWTNTARLAGINTRIAGNVVSWFTTVMNLSSVSIKGATIAVKGLTWALRALEVATAIGAVIAAISFAVELFGDSASDASDELGKFGDKADVVADSYKRVQNVFESTSSQTYSTLMTSYKKLQAGWKSLSDEHQKIAWIKDNQREFQSLGLKIDGVSDAENAFVKNTDAVVQSFIARAKAAARLAQLTEEYKLQNELIDKINTSNDAAQARHHVNAGDKANITSWDRKRDGKYIELASDGSYRYTQAGADRANRVKWIANSDGDKANREALRQSRARTTRLEAGMADDVKSTSALSIIPSGGGSSTTRTAPSTTPRTSAVTPEPPSVKGSINWYRERLEELQREIESTSDEQLAMTLQADYKAIEKELGEYRVRIGIEEPRKEEVQTVAEKMQSELIAAQRDFDNALTVEAKVAAAAKVSEIQAQIDEATSGKVTIGADVEASYIEQGSDADKRRSYANAQQKASRIQQDYEIGLIGKDKALSEIAELNIALEKLGLKPIEIEVMTDDISKAKEKYQGATDAISSMGQSISGLGSCLELPELNIAGTLAQAIATMAQGYATATAESATLGPWAWIAFAAAGLAQLTAMISSVKQVTAFAQGGVVSGPTLALVGEYAGASSNPEVIAPLDKLRGMLQPAGMAIGKMRFELHGRKLVGVLSNETRISSKSGRRSNIVVNG
ncbi:MAG: hypothetical protein IKZ61_11875 [Prevotella sp.]|nr:hypothetical protein [Prevotella sp.]